MASQDILINWAPQETRVAIVENGAVQELHVERALERGLGALDGQRVGAGQDQRLAGGEQLPLRIDPVAPPFVASLAGALEGFVEAVFQ